MRLSAVLGSSHHQPVSDVADDFEAMVELWLASLVRDNYSAHTVMAYRTNMYYFGGFLASQGVNWQNCDKKITEQFVVHKLEHDRVKSVSIKQSLSAISHFYQFANHHLSTPIKNPTDGYHLKSSPRPLPAVLDMDLMTQLLDQPKPTDVKQASLWVRDKAMFEMMYGSGLRLSELVGLDVGDVDLSDKTVRVLGKGKKTRIIPVGSKAVESLLDYLPYHEVWGGGQKALFISSKGARLTTRAVQLRLKVCAKRAGIGHNLYPHLLRHCFASHVLSSSGNLRAVQEMLGHDSVATTQIYTHMDFGSLNRIYDNAHPRATKSKT
ncbi:MAG: tyrosine recombinase XerC [Moraxella sp.]|uniref:tyrosine recombinase XerC n=1 Tax=Moraxella sp. TaxID=479 RepID=UPI0026DA965F|nr:tyrosine recombinase XerC [Moraxella sp.]MDO4450288.1 tyrosine recombinase XerC [Moraxella sp.]